MPSRMGLVHAGPALDTTAPLAGVALPIDGTRTTCESFQANVAKLGDEPALKMPRDSVVVSWREYGQRVEVIAEGLHALGVRRGDAVGIMLKNRPEFFMIDTAAQHLGATPFSVYNTLAAEQIAHELANAGNRILIVEREFLAVARSAIRLDGNVEHVVVLDSDESDALSFDELCSLQSPGFDFEATWRAVEPGDVATLIYTSGTTGPPKGVELTHANLLAQWHMLVRRCAVRPYGRLVSYLPSAHIADRTTGIYCVNMMGFTVTCCPDPSQLLEVLRETRPTLFLAVPRIWEKFKSAVEAKIDTDPDPAAAPAFRKAMTAGLERVRAGQMGAAPNAADLATAERDSQTLASVRGWLGLDQVENFMIGAAPTPTAVHEFFAALGMPLAELWGMSESSAIVTWNPQDAIRFGTVGPPLPGVEVMLADDGEILVRGPSVMRQYRNDPQQTAEAIDGEGWLHTGDVGAWDDHGYLKLVDRKKELIINSAGKNMSPMNIESVVQGSSPLIGQVCVVGDGRSYLVALLVLDSQAAQSFARQHGMDASDLEAFAGEATVLSELEAAVASANCRLSRVEQIKRWVLLPHEWNAGDELTPTMKLRRKVVERKYADRIESLYRDDDALSRQREDRESSAPPVA